MALVSIGTDEALQSIDRQSLYSFINSMRQPIGGFHMHDDGELDIRGAYCAIACASICNIVDDKLFEGTAAWIAR
jgi:protein farnesyltransferase subunit beta